GVIAQTQANPIERGPAELRQRALVIAAGIDERDDADGFGNLDGGFQVEHQTLSPADRYVAVVERSGHLIAIRPDRSAAAGIYPLVGWKGRQRGAGERAERELAGEDRTFLGTQP